MADHALAPRRLPVGSARHNLPRWRTELRLPCRSGSGAGSGPIVATSLAMEIAAHRTGGRAPARRVGPPGPARRGLCPRARRRRRRPPVPRSPVTNPSPREDGKGAAPLLPAGSDPEPVASRHRSSAGGLAELGSTPVKSAAVGSKSQTAAGRIDAGADRRRWNRWSDRRREQCQSNRRPIEADHRHPWRGTCRIRRRGASPETIGGEGRQPPRAKCAETDAPYHAPPRRRPFRPPPCAADRRRCNSRTTEQADPPDRRPRQTRDAPGHRRRRRDRTATAGACAKPNRPSFKARTRKPPGGFGAAAGSRCRRPHRRLAGIARPPKPSRAPRPRRRSSAPPARLAGTPPTAAPVRPSRTRRPRRSPPSSSLSPPMAGHTGD